MKVYPILAVAAVAAALRFWWRRRGRAPDEQGAPGEPGEPGESRVLGRWRALVGWGPLSGDVGLVAAREVRERVRGRVFRIGTLLILVAVAAAVVVPTLTGGPHPPQRVGVVGTLSAPARAAVTAAGRSVGAGVHFVPEPGQGSAERALRSGTVDLAVVDGRELVVRKPIEVTDTSTTAQFVRAASKNLGIAQAVESAHLSAAQSAALSAAKPLPVRSLQPGSVKGATRSTSVIGIILVFLMLTQYNTWILLGVMEEKSSRVIEVLLAAVRPIRLLTGKVVGIGLVAFAQASLIVVFALVLAEAVGSDLLHGTAPLVLVSTLAWLVLGYVFYCWVYAAAGSLAERQDQIQTLALPLNLPIIFGYIMALTAASSGSVSPLFRVLAYLPPTAPFAMPVLVGLGAVTWWQFLASALVTVACTVVVARVAAGIYRRAILRTGGRVKLREVLSRSRGATG